MKWSEVRLAYPLQWLVVETLSANTTLQKLRLVDEVTVIEQCNDGADAFNSYRQLHKQFPSRELYFVHTSREKLQLQERTWAGIRAAKSN